MSTDAGPVEEGMESLFMNERSIEVVIVREIQGAAAKSRLPDVLSTENGAAESIPADFGDS